MYYLIKDGQIVGSSENPLWCEGHETIQMDFTDEQKTLIEKRYDFIDGEFVKGERAEAFEAEQKVARKQEIIMELGKLKQEKDGLEMLMEDTDEVDAKITALKKEYKTLL